MQISVSVQISDSHGHGHGHGIFILATHPEGICSDALTNNRCVSLSKHTYLDIHPNMVSYFEQSMGASINKEP
jgi:hypothetical protein